MLVPSSVFVSAQESRRAEGVQRVRSFGGDQLAQGARLSRFDRLRVVLSQPYNKHCQVTKSRSAPSIDAVAPFLMFVLQSVHSLGCRLSTCSSRRRMHKRRRARRTRWRGAR